VRHRETLWDIERVCFDCTAGSRCTGHGALWKWTEPTEPIQCIWRLIVWFDSSWKVVMFCREIGLLVHGRSWLTDSFEVKSLPYTTRFIHFRHVPHTAQISSRYRCRCLKLMQINTEICLLLPKLITDSVLKGIIRMLSANIIGLCRTVLLRIWTPQIKREGRRVMRPWYLGALKCHAIRPNQALHLWRKLKEHAHFIISLTVMIVLCFPAHPCTTLTKCTDGKHAKMQRHKHTDVADAQTTRGQTLRMSELKPIHTHTYLKMKSFPTGCFPAHWVLQRQCKPSSPWAHHPWTWNQTRPN
jgi:hypothetical protein